MLRLERSTAAKSPGLDRPQLVEIIAPRTNTAALSAADHLFASLVGTSGLSFELAGGLAARRLYGRAADPALATRFALQLGAAYPQAHVRPVSEMDDPARLRSGEQVAACTLQLAEPEYLPLRVARDAELAAERAPQSDPLLAVLAALGDLPPGWRALVQLVLWPAPADWARPHLRRSLEHALALNEPQNTAVGPPAGAGWSAPSCCWGWSCSVLAWRWRAALVTGRT